MAKNEPTNEKEVQASPVKKRDEIPTTRDEQYYITPPVDIYETDNGLTVIADLPGVRKEDIDIKVDNGVLTMHGKPDYEAGDSIVREFNLTDFYRQFQLSEEVDQEKITAEMNNGVLTIKLPKAEKAKPRQISVELR